VFGPAHAVSAPNVLATGASAAFDPATGHAVVAWSQPARLGQTGPVETASGLVQ
jgi:hypothetical protein